MSSLNGLIDSVYRAYAVAGDSSSGVHDPIKSEIRSLLKQIVSHIEILVDAELVGEGLYRLVSDLPSGTDGDVAIVFGESDNANNGLYLYTTQWTKEQDFVLPSTVTADITALQNRVTQLETDYTSINSSLQDVKAATIEELDITKYVPSNLCVLGSKVQGHSTDIQTNSKGNIVHTAVGNSNFIRNFKLTSDEIETLSSGGTLKLLIKLVSGSFSTTPYVQLPANATSSLNSDGWYEITLTSSHAVNTNIRLRWTAAENTEIVPGVLIKPGQELVEAGSSLYDLLTNRWAEQASLKSGDQKHGIRKKSTEDLSGAADLQGNFLFSHNDQFIQTPGNGRSTLEIMCRGVLGTGDHCVLVGSIQSETQGSDFKDITLTAATGFTSDVQQSDHISAIRRMGDLVFVYLSPDILSSTGATTPTKLFIGVDNRPALGNPSNDQAVFSLLIQGLYLSSTPVDLYYFINGEYLDVLSRNKWDEAALVGDTITGPFSYSNLIDAARLGIGNIDVLSDSNNPGGLSLNYPAYIRSSKKDIPIIGGWDEIQPSDFTDNSDGTFSYTLTRAHQSGLTSDVFPVVKKTSSGEFISYTRVSSTSDVDTNHPAYHFNTTTKSLTVSDNETGSVYITNPTDQINFLEIGCRVGRSSGKRVVLENIDVRYGQSMTIFSDMGVHETRGILCGYAGFNGQQTERGAYWKDHNSHGRQVGNDIWGANSFVDNPVTWELSGTSGENAGADTFAPHGTWINVLCDLGNPLRSKNAGKAAFVTITPGHYRFSMVSEASAQSTATAAILLQVGTALASVLELGYIETPSISIPDGFDPNQGFFDELVCTVATGNNEGETVSINDSELTPRKQSASRSVQWDPGSILANDEAQIDVRFTSGIPENATLTAGFTQGSGSILMTTQRLSSVDARVVIRNVSNQALDLSEGKLTVSYEARS